MVWNCGSVEFTNETWSEMIELFVSLYLISHARARVDLEMISNI